MAKKELAFEASVDIANGAKSIKSLRNEYKDAQNELNGLTVGTKEYIKQLEKLGNIKDQIGDLNSEISAFNPEGKVQAFGDVIGGLASGFQAAQGAAALFGAEGEALQKTLLKVQAASAFADGIKGIAGLGDGFNKLKLIINSNPIMIVATIIASIGTALFALKDKIGFVGEVFDHFSKVIGFVIDKIKEFTDWLGISTFAAEEQAEAVVNAAKKQQEAVTQRYDDEIALAKAAGKNTFELEQKKQIAILQSAKTQIEALKGLAKAQGKWNEDQLKELEALGKVIHDAGLAIKTNNIANEKEQTEKQEEEYKKRLDLAKKYEEEKKKNAQAEKDRYLQALKDFKELNEAIDKIRREEAEKAEKERFEQSEKEVNEVLRNQSARMELMRMQSEVSLASQLEFLGRQRDIELANTDLTETEKLAIKEKYAQMESQMRMEQFDKQLEGYQQLVQATQVLTDMAFAHQLKQANGNAQKERQIRKKQFQVNKAFGIANSVIDGIQAVQKALNNPYPLNIILAVASGIMATANTVKIASTKFDDNGGGGGAGGAIGGNISMAGSGANVAPPSTGSTLLNPDGTIKKNGKTEPPMVKAVVTETDITGTQKRVNSIEEKSQIK